jgi:predicted naringenin-chalcone synthase
MNHSFITRIGIANPEIKLTQEQVAETMAKKLNYTAKETKKLVRFYKKTAIQSRYIIIDPLTIPFSATTAERMKIYEHYALNLAQQAIEKGIDHELLPKITHLITVSCTGMYAPGLDIELTLSLNLSSDIERTCINFMGCYGAFNALKMADYICRQNPEAYVLIVCVELCSLHFQPMTTRDQVTANALFADGAACVLVCGQPQSGKNLRLQSFRCALAPSEQPAMAWYVRDHGFDIILSSYVPSILSAHIREPIQKLLNSLNIDVIDVDYFAIHPGGKEILSAVEQALGINSEKNQAAHDILNDYGNMSSPTILFVLQKWFTDPLLATRSHNLLAMAFGPGLTIESALLETYAV